MYFETKLKLLENGVSNGNLIFINSIFSNDICRVLVVSSPNYYSKNTVRNFAEGCYILSSTPQKF
jgi:hypothetical protein